MSVADDLRAARDLILDPDNWCVWVLAENKDRRGVPADDPRAVAFCAAGALQRVTQFKLGQDSERYRAALAALERAAADSVSYVNDTLGFEATHEMYAKAIKLAEDECEPITP